MIFRSILRSIQWARAAAFLGALALVASCGLPRVGPNKNEIYAGSVERAGDSFIIPVTDQVNRIISVQPALGFSTAFTNSGVLASDIIRPGDTLGLTIWENVDNGLMSSEGVKQTPLEEIQVDSAGFIFVPFAGRIRAAGNTPEALRRIITDKLDEQTPDPQVEVRRLAGDGSTVSILGTAGAQGVYPIERPTRTLSAMISAAGGVAIPLEVAQITVIRGGQRGKVWLQDLYDNPQYDIALRGGDRILIEEDTRSFTSLGATGGQARVPFDKPTLSAIEAIAQVGGLSPATADPTGVFILRNEPAEITRRLTGRRDLIGSQRLVYVLDLTKPNGMFMARDFAVRDGDTLYVTEAPFAQWTKVIGSITGTLGSVGSVSQATQSLGGN